ncbi:putative dynein regulator, partial [Globisporangium splendens]
MSDRLPCIIAEGRKLRGTFCAEWLPYMTSTADGWLLDSNGSPYKLAHTSLSVGTAQLGDILRWEWIRPGVLNFIPTCGISGFYRPSIRALERLCATLVSNFPQLLYRPQQTNVLRLYNGQRHYNHEWHLHTSEATLTHVDTTLVKATHTVHSAMDCDIMATRDLNGQKVSFHAHRRFTRIVQLWGGNGRYNTTRSFYRQQVAATRTQIGKDTRDAAVNKAVHTAGSLWPGLQLIQWSESHNIPGITEKADLSCSNPECSQVVQSSVQHLFWECPKAKLVWNYFYALWAKIGITPDHDPAIWIFSLDLPDTPRHAWTTIKRHIIGHKFSNEHLQDHLYSVAHTLWRYVSASLIQSIWCAHLRRMDSDPIESTAEMAIMTTRLEAGMRNLTRLAEAQAGDSDGHAVTAVLKAYVDCFLSQTDAIPLTPNDTRGVYLLFFDGGSRGNPGPGGTGSIIMRVHKDSHTASLIWTASMAYSRKDTTNNFAEYWGLIHGLREAQRSHFESLYVIGDSALIISQQRMHRSPRQHRLARLYQTSRRLADCIDIRGWYHHYYAFNKMADSAANLAMDTRTSTQVHFPTQRAAFNNLTQDLDNDVMHWHMRSSEDPRHQSMLDYLHGMGERFADTAAAFEREAGITKSADGKHAGLLEKKWTSVIRLQRKVMELENKVQLLEETTKLGNGVVSRRDLLGGGIGGRPRSEFLPRAPPKYALTGHRSPVTCVAFHPVFSVFASGSEDATVKVWDFETGEYERTLKGHTNAVQAVAFNSAGTLLASTSADLSIKLWDFSTDGDYECLKTLRGHDHNVCGVVFATAGEDLLYSCSRDHTIKVWEISTGYCVNTLNGGHSDWVRDVAVSDDGLYLATCGNDRSILLWDLQHMRVLQSIREHEHVVESVTFAKSGAQELAIEKAHAKKLAAVGAVVATGNGEAAARSPEEALMTDMVVDGTNATTSPSVRRVKFLLSGSRDRTVRLWEAFSGTLLMSFASHENWVRCVRFHPCGKYAISAAEDKTIRVYDLEVRTMGMQCWDTHWSILLICQCLCVCVCVFVAVLLQTGRCVRTLDEAHGHFLTSVDVHPTLPLMISGGIDKLINVWECS